MPSCRGISTPVDDERADAAPALTPGPRGTAIFGRAGVGFGLAATGVGRAGAGFDWAEAGFDRAATGVGRDGAAFSGRTFARARERGAGGFLEPAVEGFAVVFFKDTSTPPGTARRARDRTNPLGESRHRLPPAGCRTFGAPPGRAAP